MITSLPWKVYHPTHRRSGRFTVAFVFIGALIGGFTFTPSTVLAVNHRPKIVWVSNASGTSGPNQQISGSTSFANETFAVTDADTPTSLLVTAVRTRTAGTWATLPSVSASSVTGGTSTITITGGTTTGSNSASATITLTVTETGSPSGNSVSTSFTLQRNPSGTSVLSIGGIPDQTSQRSYTTDLRFFTDQNNVSASAIVDGLSDVGVTFDTPVNRSHTFHVATGTTDGTATVTITATPSTGATLTTSFIVMVTGSTTPPTISSLGRYQVASIIPCGSPTPSPTPFTFTVGDDNNPGNLAVSATSSNATLVPNTSTNIVPGGSGTARNVSITPACGQSGASTITIAVSDNLFTRYAQFLYVVQDPNDPAMTFSRPKGVYILDTAACGNDPQNCTQNPGHNHQTPWGTWIDLRDVAIRPNGHTGDYGFVEGYTLRVPWTSIENNMTADDYDFYMIDNALSLLAAQTGTNQKLSIIIQGEPDYIENHSGAITWCTDGTTNCTDPVVKRPVPWDDYLQDRWDALLTAMGSEPSPAGGGLTLGTDPRLAILNPSMPGGDSGIRDPAVNLVSLPGFTEQKLLDAAEYYLSTLQNHFPGKYVQIGFWKLNETGHTGLTEYVRTGILDDFDGIVRPRVGFWQENLGATRLTAAREFISSPEAYTSTPLTSFATPLRDSEDVTWTAFQTLDSWAGFFEDSHAVKMFNGSPNDAYEAAYKPSGTDSLGYKTQYFETYVADVDYEAQQPQAYLYPTSLYRWHDYFATLNPIEAPAGLTVTPTSSTSNDVSWMAVYGATSYTLVRQPLPTGTPATFSGLTTTTYSDTGLTAGTPYAYKVLAIIGSSTSDYSPSVVVFRSKSTEDGYVASGQVNASGTGAAGIRAGQSTNAIGQLKGVVSFDTGALPDGCTVLGAVLREEQGSADITALDTCTVEIVNGSFNGNATLETADFTAGATDPVGELPKVGANGWAQVDLAGYLDDINTGPNGTDTTGRTQFRQSFPVYGTPNTYMSWYPGESTGNEPQLVIRYQ
jgi:hypothetical protein